MIGDRGVEEFVWDNRGPLFILENDIERSDMGVDSSITGGVPWL